MCSIQGRHKSPAVGMIAVWTVGLVVLLVIAVRLQLGPTEAFLIEFRVLGNLDPMRSEEGHSDRGPIAHDHQGTS